MPCRKIEFVTSCVLDLHIQVSSHLRSSHLTSSSHPHDICASSHLRSSHLRFSYRRIFNPHQQIIPSQIFICYIFTSAAHLRIFIAQLLQSSLSLHIFGSSSPSYLIIFKISVCHCYNLVDLRLQNFMSINIFPSLSGQPSSSVCCFLAFKRLLALVLSGCFTFSPAQWAPPQLNGPVQQYIKKVTKTVY